MATDTGPIHVLHVDDDPAFGDITAEYLEAEDERITVESVSNAEEGLDLLRTVDFDCIVSDYDMPGRDGIDFLVAVRAEYPDLPFVLYTGKGSEEVASEAISKGASDYLQKEGGTSQYEVLANRVENVVSKHRAERDAEATHQWYQRLIKESTDVIGVLDAQGFIEYLSPAADRIIGYSPAELVGENAFEYIHEDDRAGAQEQFFAMLDDPSYRRSSTFRFRHQDESWRWLEARGRNLSDDPIIGGIVVYTRDISEQQKRERELNRERDRFTALYENFPEPTITYEFVDDEPIIRAVNDAFVDVFGFEAETAVGRSIDDILVPPDDLDEANRLNERVKAGELLDEEVRRETVDGTGVFWLRNISIPDPDRPDGFAVYTDVTERKQQWERFQAFVEQSTDVITVLDPDGTYAYQSPSITGVLGYDPQEMIGDNSFDYVHPEDRETVREVFEEAVSDPSIRPSVEYRYRHADGSWRWLESHGNNQLENPEVNGFVVNSRDITDRKEREQKITALHEVATDFDTSETADAVYGLVVDAAEDILDYDQAVADAVQGEYLVAKATSSDLDPDEYFDLTPVDAEDNLAAQAFRTGETSKVDDLRTQAVTPAQSEYRAALTIPLGEYGVFQAVSDEPGAFDETDQELAELLCTHARNALTRIEHRRDLQHQNERLEAFVNVVSHDLRNPLDVAINRLELAQEDCDSEHLGAMEDAHDRMAALITDLLALARTGSEVGTLESIALDTLARRCWRTVQSTDATLDVQTEVTLLADRTRLQQLLENLFGNAIQHGGDDVTITVGDLDRGFFVEDDGPGIPEENAEKLFEPGFTSAADGTGFGLNIAKEIAEAHDWEIRLAPGSETGARFEITGLQRR